MPEIIHPLPLKPRRRQRRGLRWLAGVLVLLIVGGSIAAWMASQRMEPWLRARIVEELGQRFQARVELDEFHLKFAGELWVDGKGLRIWPSARAVSNQGQGAAKAMIQIEKFRFHTPLSLRAGRPVVIRKVELEGLTVDLPPRGTFAPPVDVQAPVASGSLPSSAAKTSTLPQAPVALFAAYLHFQVEQIECQRAQLTIETSKEGKLPLQIPIAFLRLTRNGDGGAMEYVAQLTNPRPAGEVHTAGNFGPWKTSDPGETPLEGQFRLEKADLGTIPGIAGHVDAVGQYRGSLRDLEVAGETRVPDFSLTEFGTRMPLRTRFHGRVDTTNGDTWLDPVEATLGNSHFRARGDVVRVIQNGSSIGRAVHFQVNVDRGHIEDFLRFTSHAASPAANTPFMSGRVQMETSFNLVPGTEPMDRRVAMQGRLILADALFASPKIQEKINELSQRGQGNPQTAGGPARSAMESSFNLSNGSVYLPDLVYTVPGATIQLKGNYGIEKGALDFAGDARLDAPVSKLVGGWKGDLLKPLDRFFSKGSRGTVIPIRIGGTRENPDFGADLGPFHFDSATHAKKKR